ncbi:unnamed protein product [Paramecium primaurelia]|uniref:Uncharacterized protein n=1 Tax=Paramecium primaurelia TaxID=5886 RepID=A0A8S1KXK7_PARPR|nr:unnamed protein product [Paramecium primaurelia]
MKNSLTKFYTLNSFSQDKTYTFVKLRKEQLQEEIIRINDETEFEDFAEFKTLNQNETIISIKYTVDQFYDPFQQQEIKVEHYVQELIYNVRRKYPWITILEKRISQSAELLCQIQLYNQKQKIVLFNKPFTNTQHILELLKLYIERGTINIKFICHNQDIIALGGQLNNLFEDAFITISQKDKLQINDKSHIPAKLITINKKLTSNFINFKDLPLNNDYVIDVQGKHFKYVHQEVNFKENIIELERNDIIQAKYKLIHQGKLIEADKFMVNGMPIIFNGEYRFWTKPQTEYIVNIEKLDYYPKQHILITKGFGEYKQEIEMIKIQKTILKITSKNIIDSSILDNVDISIDGKIVGQTNKNGTIVIQNLELRSFIIKAAKKGFLTMPLQFDISANNIGQSLLIEMFPDYFSLMNQFHILVVKPKSAKNLSLQLVDLDEQNKSNIQQKIVPYNNGTIVNYGIHISNFDVFDKQKNIYQLFIKDSKEVLPRCRQTIANTNKKSQHVNSSPVNQMKTRINNQNSDLKTERGLNQNKKVTSNLEVEHLHIYLSFGMDIVCSQIFEVEKFTSKVYATINLQRRIVELDGKAYNCRKQKSQQKTNKRSNTGNILQLLTNQI